MSRFNFIFALFDNAHEGIAIFNKGEILKLNPAFKDIFRLNKLKEKDGFSRIFLTGKEVVFLDADGQSVPFEEGPVQKLLRQEYFPNTRFHVLDKQFNNDLFCDFRASNVSFGEDNFDILYVKDIFDSYNLSAPLKSERLLLTEILDAIPVMVAIYDPDFDEVYLNKAVKRILGWTREDIKESDIMTLAYPNETYREEITNYMIHSHHGFRDIIMRTKDGRDIITSWANVLIADGRKVGIGIDINDQRVAENNLRLKEQKFRNLADNISQHAWMSDRNGMTLWFNKRWYDYTGTVYEDVKGMGWAKLVHPDHLQRILTNYKASIKVGKTWDDSFPIKNDKGEFRWFLSRAQPIKDESGKIISWFGTNTDITKIKDLQKELQESHLQVEEALQLQKTFIQNISHEVRTPMNSILGFSELLSKTFSSGVEAEYLDSIRYNGRQLLNLIDDIIDFSRLDSRELNLSKEMIPLEKIFKYLANQYEALTLHFKKNDIVLKINIREEDEGESIYADEYRIQQVLNNLLSNAVKYTVQGYVEIGYRIQRAEKQILFFVKDSGIGIKESQRESIFNRFNQSHQIDVKNIKGTGLGLAISKQLVELFGGEIWFESKLNMGSNFFFTHSFDEKILESSPRIMNPDNSDSAMPDLKGKRILIAEDDDFSFRLLEAMLYDTKAEILHASCGEEAVKLFNNNHIDLVFLDIRLPGLDGYEILAKIRETDKQVPIIAQSAYAMPEEKKKSFEAGFNFHATKPITTNALYSILNCFLAVHKEAGVP